MATISKQENRLIVKLSGTEKIESLHGGFEVPLESVKEVEVVEDPIHEVHGLQPSHSKLYGMYLPGESAVGVFLHDGLKDKPAFIAVHHNDMRGVRIMLNDTKYSELLIGCANPEEIVKLLTEQ